MGFFDKVFDQPPSDVRSNLEESYVRSFSQVGWSPSEARQTVRAMLQRADERSRSQGTDKYPPNFGDILLKNRENDSQAATIVARLHEDGVTDDDIRWWWNLHDLERCMLAENDEMSRFALFRQAREQGQSQEEAKQQVVKHFPIFGDPQESTGDDRPLPFELKDRINRFLESPGNQQYLRSNALRFSSMNAYIRDRIKNDAL
jgi:hypothetical protein